MSVINGLLRLAEAKCPHCLHQLEISDPQQVALKRELVCGNCGWVIKTQNHQAGIAVDKSQAQKTSQVKVAQHGNDLQVDIRWLSKSSKFIVTFAIIWNVIISSAGFAFFQPGAQVSFMIYPITILFAVIGLWLAYSAVCEFLNTTSILVKKDKIVFWTTPLSLSGPATYPLADIANLGLERSEGGEQNGRRIYNHFINIHFKNGDIVRLTRVQDMNEGIYVEHILEERLGLQDNPQLDQIGS